MFQCVQDFKSTALFTPQVNVTAVRALQQVFTKGSAPSEPQQRQQTKIFRGTRHYLEIKIQQ